jgi:CrtC N-terminal lipocalin domain
VSYYYFALYQHVTGTLTTGDTTRRVSGIVWLEHQWGNFWFGKFNAPARYIWMALKFDAGGGLTFRQWYRPDLTPALEINRWLFFREDGTAEYGFGPGMTYLPGWPWISPTTQVPYYTSGRLVTPRGSYFLTPIVANQETLIPPPRYGLWEGTVWVRQAAEDGPVVGRGYLECPDSFAPF